MTGAVSENTMALAFMPRAIAGKIYHMAARGASADRLLQEARELDGNESWRPEPGALRSQIRALRASACEVLLPGDESYPALLRHIADPPLCLFVRGRLPGPRATMVAVVGSRSSCGNALVFTEDLARSLARAGLTVVSGLARGVDSAAHKGCIEGGGVTVAVLGCGVDICYPRENKTLMGTIARGGAVLSEYPMGTAPQPYHFPCRNRLISGLCVGIIVVEGGARSGALVTAKCAAQQGRTVFAVPGAVWNPLSDGPNALIADGAVPVRGPDDVLQELMGVSPCAGGKRPKRETAGGPERAVLDALDHDQGRHVDVIARASGTPPAEVLTTLLRLEVKGLAGRLPGMRFFRVGKGI